MDKKYTCKVTFILLESEEEIIIESNHNDLKTLLIYTASACSGIEKEITGLKLLDIKVISNDTLR